MRSKKIKLSIMKRIAILFPKGDDTGSLTKLSSFSFASAGIGNPVDVNEGVKETVDIYTVKVIHEAY
jgi:hypothetical protein